MKRKTQTSSVIATKSTIGRRALRQRLRGVEPLEPRLLMAVSIGDYVWNDLDFDGIQNEAASEGVNDVVVSLFTSAGTQVGVSTQTSNDALGNPGYYSFDDVAAGDYYVLFVAPTGRAFTTPLQGGNPNTDSNAEKDGKSGPFTLVAGEANLSIDAGLVATASVGTFVWWDENADGLQVDLEGGIEGATVRLLENGSQIAVQTTDEFGQYFFENLAPGTYAIQFDRPVGFELASPPDVPSNVPGRNDKDDSDGLGTTLITADFTLAPGQVNRDIDQGFYKPGKIGNYVWRDVNNNGVQDETADFGINGVTVTLFTGSGAQVGSPVVTANDGSGNPGFYRFDGLNAGQYYVRFTVPAGQVFTTPTVGDPTKDSNVGPSGQTGIFNLQSGIEDLSIDAGLRPIDLSLTSFVTDPTPPINSTITYSLTLNNPIGFSSASGVTVSDVLPPGLTYVSDNAGGAYNTATRSWTVGTIAPGDSVLLQVVATITSGGTKTNVAQVQTADQPDFDSIPGNAPGIHEDEDVTISLTPSANVGNYVWRDVNNDGVQNEAAENGINGVKVTLYTSTGTQVGIPAFTDNDFGGNPGYYFFSDINPGSYYVVVTPPTGQVFTTQFAGLPGTPTTDSNVDSAGRSNLFAVESGVDNLSIDAGLRPIDLSLTMSVNNATPTIGSNVNITLIVTNANGFSTATGVTVNDALPPGLNFVSATFSDVTDSYAGNLWTIGTLAAGQSATLTITATVATGGTKTNYAEVSAAGQLDIDSTPNNNSTTEDDDDQVSLTPPAAIGDYVWLDRDADGQQDVGEPGLDGLTVKLLDATGTTVLFTTTTGDNPNLAGTQQGYYEFKGLTPGSYVVQFFTGGGYDTFTTLDVAPDATDSDANVTTGKTAVYVLASGDFNQTVDAGLKPIDLSLTKTVNNTTPSVGSNVIFTLTVNNANGFSTATGVTVKDALPAGLTFVSATPSQGSFAANIWTIGTLTAGQTVTLAITATVATSGTNTNYAEVSAAGQLDIDSTPNNNSTTEDDDDQVSLTPVATQGDLSITKTDGLACVVAGSSLTYTIIVSNSGPAIATGAVVNDTFPTLLTNVSYTSLLTGTGSQSAPSGTNVSAILDTVTLGSGSSIKYLVTGTVPASAGASKLSDFTSLGANNTTLAQNVTVNGVRADAFYLSGASYLTTNTTLYLRNEPNDNGLGVVSNGENPTLGGDVNELSNQANLEVIRLTKAANDKWTSLWVSSLDNGGSNSMEMGTMYWSNSATPDLSTLSASSFTFKYSDFGTSSEGNVLSLNLANFDATANYLFFRAGPNAAGTDNDYLVWKATTVANSLVNTATVTPPVGFTDTNSANNSATDTDCVPQQLPGIDIEKKTSGSPNANPVSPDFDNEDTANGAGVPVFTAGSAVTWTYKITNTGNVNFTTSEIVVVDDNGTPSFAGDDMSISNGKITFNSVAVGDADNILEPGEVWLYTATGTVQNVLVPTSGASTTFDFQGSTTTSGTVGNIRTFNAGPVAVKASGFSRDRSNGSWATGYLGSYGGGLGVTDSSEGTGANDTHTVDNTGGRDNYVLFEFSQSVIVDSTFLGYVVTDSDLTYWIGTKTDPFNSHLTLSDALLTSLGFTEVNATTLTSSRTVDINPGNLSGNVLIIAADVTDTTPEDYFKIQNLIVTPSVPGVYENKGVVTVPGATDNDLSHYKNPLPPGIQIVKDVVGQTIVPPNTPVDYTYSVTNTGGIALSNIVVIDDNTTQDFSGDDFNPKPVLQTSGPYLGKNIGDLDGDNLLDTTEIWKYSAKVIPPVVMTVTVATGATPISSGVLSYTTLANGDIRVHYRQDNNFNDNTYGTGSDLGWTSQAKTHKFTDLTGSDKAGFLVKYSDGTTLAQFYQDYISLGGTNTEGYAAFSGYQSLGFSGGDGSFVSGNSAVLKDFDSTLETDLNQAGIANNGVAYAAMITNSPVNDSKWDVVDGYSFVIDRSAFTTKSFGGVTIFDQHNSPPKVGASNTYVPTIVGGGSVNTATVTGIGNGSTVEDDDEATVSIIAGPLGSLGDRVWFDTNANGLQNSGESGIVGVRVNLAGDFDKNGTIDYTATTTTGANGIYTFTGLPAGEYFVTIDATTLPANYVQIYDLDGLATLNTAVGELAAGQNRTDFDFGYVASAPGFSLVKTADKATAAFGESVTYTYLVTNNGMQPLTNVVVKDDNGTPSDPNDDFNPTRVADVIGNNDITLAVGEVWKYTATITPPIRLSAVNVNGYTGPAGTLSRQKLPNGDYRITYLQSTNINDNVYGTSAVGVWPGNNHTFSHLTGSDKAGFELKNASGTTVMKFYMDYISASTTQETTGEYASYSGYRSLGATGGDGSMLTGTATNLYDFDSTLEVNLNRAGYTTAIVNSPANDVNWNVVNGYSFTVKAAAFGASTLGSMSIFDQHNSPSKLGVNSFTPMASGGQITNIATAIASLNGGSVVAVDDATVLIGAGSSGAPTKFFVADVGVDQTFRYSSQGANVGAFGLQSGNTDARDIAANSDGSKLWVLDKDKMVNVYTGNGTAIGQWTAGGLGKEPEGITLDPSVDPQTGKNDLWLASRDRKILWYDDAASNMIGSDSNDQSFAPSMSGNLKGVVTNGTYLWVVTEGSSDFVYRFTITRSASTGDPTALTQSGLWKLATVNSKPTGITIDPTGVSQSIWIVDESMNSVYEYGNARSVTTGTGVVSSSFKLDSTNLAPQGIADPQLLVAATNLWTAAAPIVNPFHNASNAADVNDDGVISPLDALLVINRLNASRNGLNRDLGALSVFEDVNGDDLISPLDALLVINKLNSKRLTASVAAEAGNQFFADLGDGKDDVDGIFATIDDIVKSRKGFA